jgi:hypothetical protein
MDSMLQIQIAQIMFGTSEGAGTAILTFLGGFHPQTQALYLSDIAHHQLQLQLFSLLLVICIGRTSVLVIT